MVKFLFLVLFGLIRFQSFGQQKLIWTIFAQGKFGICNTDGADLQTLDFFTGGSGGLKVDQRNKHIYWVLTTRGVILRTDFNFQSLDTIISGLDTPRQIELDLSNNKLYWADTGQDKIQRANLNGSSIEDVYSNIALNPHALYIDTSLQELYFSRQSGLIGKINVGMVPVTTMDVDTIVIATGMPTDIEIDFDAQKLYWSNQIFGDSKIQRCNPDGTNIEDLAVGLEATYGIALDQNTQTIYWTIWGGSFPKKIQKANFDGTNIETVIELPNSSPYALSLINDVSVNTSEEVLNDIDDIKLFPNPTDGLLTIESNQVSKAALKIIDCMGKVVKEIYWDGQGLEIFELSAGVYFLQIKSKDKLVVKKIIRT